MMYFLAILVLWAVTALLERQGAGLIPDVVQWGIWTVALYLPGVTAIEEDWKAVHARALGIVGYLLIVVYYTTQMDVYLAFLPVDAARPALWPTIFLVTNLVIPLVLVTVGCASPAVQRRGR